MDYSTFTKDQIERFLYYSNFRLWILFLTVVCSPLAYFLCFVLYRKDTVAFNNCLIDIKIARYALLCRIFRR